MSWTAAMLVVAELHNNISLFFCSIIENLPMVCCFVARLVPAHQGLLVLAHLWHQWLRLVRPFEVQQSR